MRSLPWWSLAFAIVACSPTEGTEATNDTGAPETFADVEDDLGPRPDVSETSAEADAIDDVADVADVPVDAPPSLPPVLVKTGTAGKVLLKGMIVTPDTTLAGEVLVDGNLITCVAASCTGTAGASEASIIETNGLIFPGLIDAHNHILYDIFDETDWAPVATYTDHNAWTGEPRYGRMVDCKQWMDNEAGPLPQGDYACEMDKFGELKGLVAGTTSIISTGGAISRICFGTLARTIDTRYNGGLTSLDSIRVATLTPPSTTLIDSVCKDFTDVTPIDAFVVHIGEGTATGKANTEFADLGKAGAVTAPAGCLYAPQTAITHGMALGSTEFTIMADKKMSLIWSPRSNVFLYGGGTDLTKTTDIPTALSKGINVALAPDWSMGGSQNMLDELRFADKVDNGAWADKITPKMLAQMATINAAKALHRDKLIGSIEVGKRADLMVIAGDTTKPYDALLAARPKDVNMTMVDGVILYGDPAIQPLAPSTTGVPGCETIDVCTIKKFVCVAAKSSSTTDKFGQTYADITAALTKGLTDYDALGLSTYKFAPLTPLVRCP